MFGKLAPLKIYQMIYRQLSFSCFDTGENVKSRCESSEDLWTFYGGHQSNVSGKCPTESKNICVTFLCADLTKL